MELMNSQPSEPVPQLVIEALADVRESGLTNMFDRANVIELIAYWGDVPEATAWLKANPDRFMDALNAMGEYVTRGK